MAYTVTANIPLNMPTPGTREPAQISLLNENCVQLSNHDHTSGKALAVGRMRSGLAANRPAASSAGNVYFSTDTGIFSIDTGTAWVEFLTSGGATTVTGWTLVDPIIRDALSFGPEPSGTADVTLARTAAGKLRLTEHLGLGVDVKAWHDNFTVLQVGLAGALWCDNDPLTSVGVRLSSNTYNEAGTIQKAIVAGTGAMYSMVGGGDHVWYIDNVSRAADATQTLTERMRLDSSGRLVMNNAATPSISATGNLTFACTISQSMTWFDGATSKFNYFSNSIYPTTDNQIALGNGSQRFSVLYAVAGSINTSHASMKQDFAPLDPAACVEAVQETDWLSFSYIPPSPPERTEDMTDEQWTEAQAAHAQQVADTAQSRLSKGYVLGSADHHTSDLFGTADRMSGQSTADLAVVACALQEALKRIAALEAAAA
jgi:hypothetical protein